jgi:hypothetical protein
VAAATTIIWPDLSACSQLRSQNLVLSDIQATNITPDNGKFIINADDWTAPGVDDSSLVQ